MTRSGLALVLLYAGCRSAPEAAWPDPGVPPERVSEGWIGATPVGVLLVAPAAPKELERQRTLELARRWVQPLQAHPADWHLGLLQVGTDPIALDMGVLAPGAGWPLGPAIPYPLDAIDRWFQTPRPDAGNPILQTFVDWSERADSFVHSEGVLWVYVVSLEDDTGPGITMEDLFQAIEAVPTRTTVVSVVTVYETPNCVAVQPPERLNALGARTGQIDICDDLSVDRAVDRWLDDIVPNTRIALEYRADPTSIEVELHHRDGPERLEEGWRFLEGANAVEIDLVPSSPVPVTVRYRPR